MRRDTWIVILLLMPLLVSCGGIKELLPSKSLVTYAFEGNAKSVQKSLAKGANPNIVENDLTALMAVSMRCQKTGSKAVEVTTALLEAGADPNILNSKGNAALGWAVNGCCLEVVRPLVDQGAYLDHENSMQRTPLMIAAKSNCFGAFEYLLDSGANGQYQNNDGTSVRDLAEANPDTRFVQYLEETLGSLESQVSE